MATTYPPGSLDQVLWAVRAYVMQTAPAGLLRTPELRNCHIRGNFETAGGVPLAPPRQRAQLSYAQSKRKVRTSLRNPHRVLKGGNYLSSRVVRPSTLGVRELNFCVRYGNRWILSAIVTTMVY